MKVEKTLLTCSISEFLSQTMILKSALKEWLEKTEFIEKLRYTPEYESGATEEQKRDVRRKMFAERLDVAITSAFSEYPELTSRIICAMCFIDDKDVDKYRPVDLLSPVKDMLSDEDLRGFFMSFLKSRNPG